MKVLIADDNPTIRLILRKILKTRGYTIAEARDGAEAVKTLQTDHFDALLTDWMMPNVDGVELIAWVRIHITPAPFIMMITALAIEQAQERALSAGADAYVTKPFNTGDVLRQMDEGLLLHRQGRKTGSILARGTSPHRPSFTGVGIAASTGGPSTLLKFFSGVSMTDSAAFFVVLHGPGWLMPSFVQRLQAVTPLTVVLAENRMNSLPGKIFVAPGDVHMVVDPATLDIVLVDDPPENYCRPSADPLFRSIARAFGSRSIGAVFTGMGRDGSIGAGYIGAAGGLVLAQDPSTAVMGSMPRSIIELGVARIVLPVEQIAETLNAEILAGQR